MHYSKNIHWIGFAIFMLVFAFPVVSNASTNADYTDIHLYNFDISDDFDKVTFDLSRRIPKSEKFDTPFVLLKGKKNLGFIKGESMDGGQHVTLWGFSTPLKENGYGVYTLIFRVCPANIPYKGSGLSSGCGPAKTMNIEYYPWKISTSPPSEDEKIIFKTEGDTFLLTATPPSAQGAKPNLLILNFLGKPTDAVSCIIDAKHDYQWECTMNSSKDDAMTLLVLKDKYDSAVSSTLVIYPVENKRLIATRYATFCELHLLENQGNRYKYEVVQKNTYERSTLCGNGSYKANYPARIVERDSHTLTVEAPATESFAVFAEKGDGSGPRLLHSENTFDPSLLLQGLLCQTLTNQDEETFTLLKLNNDGKEVSSCFFPEGSVVPLKGNTRVLLQERNRIVIDATISNTFNLQTSGAQYRKDYDAFPSPEVGGQQASQNEEDFYGAMFPGRSEQYEIVASGSDTPRQRTSVDTGVFPDVPSSHKYAQAIGYIKEKKIIDGFPDGTYRPDATINRAEFTKIIVAATNDRKRIEMCGSTYFVDATLEEWYNKYICTAKDEGIIGGYPDGTFRHESPISFVEASKIIVKAFGLPTESNPQDIWYKPYTDVLAEKRTIPPTIYALDHKITRGEMAEMAYRLYAGETQKPTIDYEKLLRDSGVLSERELAMTRYEWLGSEVPLDILRFKNLKTLILNNNDISIVPDEIGEFKNLESLIIFTNSLSKVPPSLTKWIKLRTLAIEGNGYGSKLTALPEDIGNLRNLEILRLHYNSISKLPSSIGKLTKLKELDLKQNALTTLPPEIGNLTSLENLGLGRNPITVWPPEMAKLTNLRVLYAPSDTSEKMKSTFKQWFPNTKVYYYP